LIIYKLVILEPFIQRSNFIIYNSKSLLIYWLISITDKYFQLNDWLKNELLNLLSDYEGNTSDILTIAWNFVFLLVREYTCIALNNSSVPPLPPPPRIFYFAFIVIGSRILSVTHTRQYKILTCMYLNMFPVDNGLFNLEWWNHIQKIYFSDTN
jgi:hypothetical protein